MRSSRVRAYPVWRSQSDGEAFAAAALSGNIGIAELQSLIQPLSGKVDYGAVEINQTFRINENFHPVGFKSGVLGFRLIDKFQNVSQTGAAGGFYANAYPLAPAATGQLSTYVLRSFRCCLLYTSPSPRDS